MTSCKHYILNEDQLEILEEYLINHTDLGFVGDDHSTFFCKSEQGNYAVVLQHNKLGTNVVNVVKENAKDKTLDEIMESLIKVTRKQALVGEL